MSSRRSRQTERRPAPCHVVAMEAAGGQLLVVVESEGRTLPATVALSRAEAHALRHIYALHAHRETCPAELQVHVDMLWRSLDAAGARPERMLISADPTPGFWLRIATRDGTADVALDVLDAAALLLSERLPAALVAPTVDVWEVTVDRLLERSHP